jgi:hypothetical protein
MQADVYCEGAVGARTGPVFADRPVLGRLVCGRATLGDVVVALVAFWAVALAVGARGWVLTPTRAWIAGFVAVGVLITIVIEQLSTGPLAAETTRSRCQSFRSSRSASRRCLQWIMLPRPRRRVS